MSFWKSERFEYIRQPHIIGLIIVIIFVISAAIFTALHRIGERRALSNMEPLDACIELIKDTKLCKFATNSEATANQAYSSVTKEVAKGVTTINTVHFENMDRMSVDTRVDAEQTESLVAIDGDNWVLDTSDGLWAHYSDPTFEPYKETDTATDTGYDFSNPASTDATEFKNNYTFEGEVSCGELTCLRYSVISEGYDEVYILFDTEDYLLRQHYGRIGDNSTSTNYTYDNISVKAPEGKMKEVDVETFNSIAGIDESAQENENE